MRSQWGSLKYDKATKTARIRYWASGSDGYKRRSVTLRNVTKREAQKHMAALQVQHSDDAPCPTVRQVWEQWMLPELEQRVESGDLSKNSIRVYRSAWKNHLSARWGDVPCDAVKAIDVQQWLLEGKTRVQAESSKMTLSIILDKAMKYDVIGGNVARMKYVLPSESTVTKRDKGIWTLGELGRVWGLVRGTPVEAPFILSAFGSCRVGESLGVRCDEVRVSGSVTLARIERQVGMDGGTTDRLKTRTSRRTVVVPGNAGRRLAALAARGDGWLADDGTGSPIGQRVLNKEFSKAVTGDLSHPYRNLRNSWQTYTRWDLGVPPWCSEILMGHNSGGVTEKYYDRPDEERLAKVISDAWDAWLAKGNVDPIPAEWDDLGPGT